MRDVELYAIDIYPTDTEASLFDELLNVACQGDGWEYETSERVTEAAYMASKVRA